MRFSVICLLALVPFAHAAVEPSLRTATLHITLDGVLHSREEKRPSVTLHLRAITPTGAFKAGWLTMPGDINIPAQVHCADLRCEGSTVSGPIYFGSPDAKYEITISCLARGGKISGTFKSVFHRGKEKTDLEGAVAGTVEYPSETVAANAWRKGTDWPRWRGPNCNGSGPDSGVALVDDLNDARLVWKNEEEMPGSYGTPQRAQAGYAGPIAVDGRIYQTWPDPTGERWDKVETPKLIKGAHRLHPRWSRNMDNWARWAFSLVTDDALLCVDSATGLTLWKTAMRGKGINATFQGRGTWISSKYGVLATPCSANGRIFVLGSTGRLYAFKADDGQCLWESHIGRRHVLMDDAAVRMLETGKISMAGGRLMHCPAYGGGVIAANDDFGNMVGFSAKTGAKLWEITDSLANTYGTPLTWTHQGKDYFIAPGGQYGKRLICVEPETGRLMWDLTVPAGIGSGHAMAISDDYVVCGGSAREVEVCDDDPKTKAAPKMRKVSAGAVCFKMTLTGAKQVWRQKPNIAQGLSAPMIHKGHVYIECADGLTTLELATGKRLATVKSRGSNSSFIAAGDRLTHAATGYYLADPKAFKQLGEPWRSPLANSVTQVLTDGRMYCRMIDGVVCYDLRKERVESREGREAEAEPDPMQRLSAKYQVDREHAVAGILALNASARTQLIPELVSVIKRDPWYGKTAAAQTLSGMNANAACPLLQKLVIQQLGKSPTSFAELCIETMRTIDPQSLRPLAEDLAGKLTHSNRAVSRSAFEAAAALGNEGAPAAASLVTSLQGKDAYRAHLAARALGGLGTAARPAIPAMIKALHSKDRELVYLTLQSLKKFGGDSRDAVPILIEILGRKEDTVLFDLIALTLRKFGTDAAAAVPAMSDVLARSKDETLAHKIFDVLHDLGPLARGALPAVAALQNDTRYRMAMRTAYILERIAPEDEDRIPAFIIALKSLQRKVAKQAADRLAKMGPKAAPAVPGLIEALDSKHPRVQRAACETMEAIGPAAIAAVPALTQRVKHNDYEFASRAARALGGIGPGAAPAVPTMVELLRPYPRQYTMATANPGMLEDIRLKTLLCEGLRDGLKGIGPKHAVPPLIKAATGKHRDRALGALQMLQLIGKDAPAAAPALTGLTESEDRGIAHGATRALITVKPAAVDTVLAAMNTSMAHRDSGTVNDAVRIVGSLVPRLKTPAQRQLATKGLIAAVSRKGTDFRMTTIEILGKLGPDAKEAVPALREAYIVKDLHGAAKSALEKIQPGKAAFDLPKAGAEDEEEDDALDL
ncbi:HEAT repeat domain-containing protein [Verrucomicrobiota bacterium]